MTRICVIGNSHTAAIKLAWAELAADFPGIELTFFAAAQGATAGLVARSGQLVPNTQTLADQIAFTSNGRRAIDPAAYDVFLTYGGLSISARSQNPDAHSTALKRLAVVSKAGGSVMATHVAQLRKITDKPIFAALAPLAAPSLQIPRPALMPLTEALTLIETELFRDKGVRFLAQPPETLLDEMATRPEFAVGSIRLEDKGNKVRRHAKGEARHMNGAYGAIWLRTHLPQLR